MESIHGFELISEWKNSSCGQTVRGKRSGRTYFIKKYQTPVHPVMNGALDAKTYENNKKKFEEYVANRRRINTTLRPISGTGGNIIIPAEEFIEDNHYMEASEFVEGVIGDDELESVLSTLSLDVKKLLMLTAAGALSSVHSKGIIHSDLKLKNVLLVRNSSGNYVAKIIDFDSAYFLDDKPMDDIIGDINYYSPELGRFSDAEDDRESLLDTLTEKSDIFSLGLIFHFYLTGHLPEAKTLTDMLRRRKERGKAIYPWSVLLNGCELQIGEEIESIKYRTLIEDMLSLDPANRPTAAEVLRRLKLPETALESVIEEPWPEHRLMVDAAKLKDASYIIFKKVVSGGVKCYELTDKNGRKSTVNSDELVSRGFAKVLREGFSEPWAEHGIRFDEEKLRSRGFVAAEQKEQGGVKGYELFRADSSSRFFTKENLIAMRYAVTGSGSASSSGASSSGSASSGASSSGAASAGSASSSAEAGICSPWEGHDIVFDEAGIRAKGYVSVVQAEMGGVKGYNCIRPDGSKQFIKKEMLIIFRMARKA